MNRETDETFEAEDPIEEAAMAWLIERDEGFAPGRAEEFAQWRLQDGRHAAAVSRLEETWILLEELPPRGAKASAQELPFPREGRGLRAALWVPLAAAAAILIAFGWWRNERQNLHAHYSTAAVEVRRVALSDGSSIALNVDTAVNVEFSAKERRVLLTAGEAHFEVAHDEARPFLVTAGGVTVRAVGTAFDVRVAPAAVEVVVASGKVRLLDPSSPVTSTADALAAAPLLEKGDRAVVPHGTLDVVPAITRLAPAQLQEALAWQKEILVFRDTPLRNVVAQFNRRNRLQLRFGEPELGDHLIGGTFAAGNVEVFVSLLERSGDLSVERNGDEIILHKVK